MKCTESRGMQQLGKHQNQHLLGQLTKQQPTQRRQSKADHQQLPQAYPGQQAVHEHKQHNLGQHTQSPEHTNESTAVAQRLKVNAEKGVIGPMRQLHQRHGHKKRGHAGLAQTLHESITGHCCAGRLAWRLRYQGAAHCNQQHDAEHRHGINSHAGTLQQQAQQDYGKDKANRPPKTQLTVAR